MMISSTAIIVVGATTSASALSTPPRQNAASVTTFALPNSAQKRSHHDSEAADTGYKNDTPSPKIKRLRKPLKTSNRKAVRNQQIAAVPEAITVVPTDDDDAWVDPDL